MPIMTPAGRPYEAFTVVTTDSWDDVREALGVVHDGFVEAGYMDPQPSGRRMIAPYLNDGVAFSVAYVGDEIAGVLALMPDGAFGLPSDSAFRPEMDELRKIGRPLFESGSLVVTARFRRHTRRVLAGLVAANIRVFRETPDAILVISTEPRQQEFYGSLSGATAVSGIRDHYGAPAVLLATDYPQMTSTMAGAKTNGQRLISSLVLSPDAPWFVDRRCGEEWPADELSVLLEEQVDTEKVAVAAGHPAPQAPSGGNGDFHWGCEVPRVTVRPLRYVLECAVRAREEVPLGFDHAKFA